MIKIMPLLTPLLLTAFLQSTAPAGFKAGVPGLVEWDRKRIFIVSSVNGKLKVFAQQEESDLKEANFARRRLGKKLIKVNLGRGAASFRFIPGEGQKFEDGELFYDEMGEWSGALIFNKPGSVKPDLLIEDNIKAIGIEGNTIYAIAGLAHLNLVKGNVYKITRQNGSWNSTRLTQVADQPNNASWTGKSFVFTTNKYVGEINTLG
jgi:hypothetical protein